MTRPAELVVRSFGPSASFPNGVGGSVPGAIAGVVHILIGAPGLVEHEAGRSALLMLVELGDESLGEHTGEAQGNEGSNIVGFARFRLGALPPSSLIELVVQPNTAPEALAAARALFVAWGFTTATCADAPGRILARLIVPFFNEALRALDERLGSASALDRTVKLGLGHPVGPIERVHAAGLEWQYGQALRLYQALGDPSFLPARRAAVAHRRAEAHERS